MTSVDVAHSCQFHLNKWTGKKVEEKGTKAARKTPKASHFIKSKAKQAIKSAESINHIYAEKKIDEETHKQFSRKLIVAFYWVGTASICVKYIKIYIAYDVWYLCLAMANTTIWKCQKERRSNLLHATICDCALACYECPWLYFLLHRWLGYLMN